MKKVLKKTVLKTISAIIIFILIISSASCCSSSAYYSGLECFINSAFYQKGCGLTAYLLPTEDFWNKYTYVGGDFYYDFKDDGPLRNERTRTLIYFIYDDETYLDAKEFVLNTVPLSEFHQFVYNDYIFVENLTFALYNAELDVNISGEAAWNIHFSETGESLKFPFLSTMICYHDEKNILMFLGLDLHDSYLEESKELYKTGDIEIFLKTYFYFYDFNQ